jgi:hypothetical protein
VYRVITYPDAGEQVAALVAEALPCYAEAFGVLELAPWNGRPYNDDKLSRLRQTLGGESFDSAGQFDGVSAGVLSVCSAMRTRPTEVTIVWVR